MRGAHRDSEIDLRHGAHRAQQQVGIERLHFLTHGRNRQRRIACRAHVQCHQRGVRLAQRKVDHRPRLLPDLHVRGVVRDAHDLPVDGVVEEMKMLADGGIVRARPEVFRHGLIDDRHLQRILVVEGREKSRPLTTGMPTVRKYPAPHVVDIDDVSPSVPAAASCPSINTVRARKRRKGGSTPAPPIAHKAPPPRAPARAG